MQVNEKTLSSKIHERERKYFKLHARMRERESSVKITCWRARENLSFKLHARYRERQNDLFKLYARGGKYFLKNTGKRERINNSIKLHARGRERDRDRDISFTLQEKNISLKLHAREKNINKFTCKRERVLHLNDRQERERES